MLRGIRVGGTSYLEGKLTILQSRVKGTTSFGMAYTDDSLLILHAAKQSDGVLRFTSGKEFINTKAAEVLRAKMQELAQK